VGVSVGRVGSPVVGVTVGVGGGAGVDVGAGVAVTEVASTASMTTYFNARKWKAEWAISANMKNSV